MEVVLKGPVTVVTEVSFPHLSSGRAASAWPGNHQTAPRRPATPAPGTEDPRFTAPASKEEELKSLRVGRQRKRRDPPVHIPVHQRLARRVCCTYTVEQARISVSSLCRPKSQQLCQKHSPSRERAGVQSTQSRVPREAAAPSHHLHQGQCSRNHPGCKQKEPEIPAPASTWDPRASALDHRRPPVATQEEGNSPSFISTR